MPPLFKYDVICSICKRPIDRKTLSCVDHGVDHGVMSPSGFINSQTVYLPDENFNADLTVVMYIICQVVANLEGFDLSLSQAIKSGESICTIYLNLTEVEWCPILLFVHKTNGSYVIKNKHNSDFIEISIERTPNQVGNAYEVSLPRANIHTTVFGGDSLRHFNPLWVYVQDAFISAKRKKEARQASPVQTLPKKGILQKVRDIISQTDIFSAP